MRRDPKAAAGFTLLETLVAMTVLALIAATLMRGVVALRADAAWSGDRLASTLVARSVLGAAVGDRRMHDGFYRGKQEGRRWTLAANPVDGDAEQRASGSESPQPRWRPQRLTVSVEAARRPVVVETVRLAEAP